MRKIDENRAKNYIKKHERYEKWLVFALCVSLLTGTATLYGLNKPATAMTEETLDQVGIVIPTADAEFEQELIELTQENKENKVGEETSGDDKPEAVKEKEDSALEDESVLNADDEESVEDSEDKLKNAESVELTGDVVLTVSYVDENGDALADEKEISLSESIDFSSEAREIEGYTFKEASIDGAVIKVITAKKDADDHKYYEAELASGDTVEIKENKTVILTYAADEEEIIADAKSVKITARYVDTDGEEIRDASELSITKELEFGDDYEEIIDGYFYDGVFFEEKEISGITPVVEEKSVKENDNKDDEELVEEPSEVTVTGYDITTKDGEVISVTEDTEIEFKYLKACEETEFTYSDQKIKVKIVTTRGGVFPEGIELKVNEVTSDTENYNYDAYMEALNENADSIANDAGQKAATQYTENNTLLYDIAFIYEGKEIQPKEGSVVVTMEFMEQQLTSDLSAQSESDVAVVHLPIKEEVKETAEIATTEEATDITSGDIKVETLADATAEVEETEKVEFTSDSFSVFAVVSYQKHEAGTDTFETVLGDAINFGIVTDSITVKESETNFAAVTVEATAQFGNDLTNPVEQTFIASKVNGDFQVKGEDAYFIVPKEYTSHITHVNETGGDHIKFDTAYTQLELEEVVKDMMQYVKDASKDLAAREQNAWFAPRNPGDKYYLDISGQDPGTYYVTINDEDMKGISEAEWLNITKRDDQTIVFNVTAAGNINLFKFNVNGVGTDKDEMLKQANNASKTVIWNFINSKSVTTSGSVVGVFISGQDNAKFLNDGTSAGWVVFPEVEIGSGEWHNTYDQIKQISGAAQFQAYKMIDGKDATVSGFKFALYKKETDGSWTHVETVENDSASPKNIFFDSVTFGGNKDKTEPNYQYVSASDVGASQDFTFMIAETNGATDANGNAYYPDETRYYAKVTVTLQYMNEASKKGIYYRVSTPTYYTDDECTKKIDGNIPTFNNTTVKGHVGILLKKYLNNADPGDLKFSFTIRALTSDGYDFKTLTEYLVNDGDRISYAFDFASDIVYNGCIYLVITENNIDNTGSGVILTKDDGYIIARVNNPGKDNQSVDYFKCRSDNPFAIGINNNIGNRSNNAYGIPWLASYVTAIAYGNNFAVDTPAFYNTGSAMLRIHKMVINDWGADFVRDGEEYAMLNHCTFRITNNSTKNYIVFTSFVGGSGETREGRAVEYDAASHQPTGNTYPVTYNRSAQWTIAGIPAGTYTVEEVGDDITFTYDPSSNTISYLYDSNLSRVTKYDVTEDKEGASKIGTGGDNYRVVYSIDLKNHYDQGPTNVKVGDASVDNTSHTQTVQVCNYYSLPIGPIKVAKNFTSGQWKDDMEFKFTIEPISYSAKDSAGNGVNIPTGQPMPIDGNTITLTGKDAHKNEDGSYSAIGMFSSIPYRFEGFYYYKITEENTGLGGVIYDKTEYFVEIKVSKKHTEFNKTYNGENMANQGHYNTSGQTTVREDFFYLGADIRYATDIGFDNVVAQCELYLGTDPKTGEPQKNVFQVNYTYGNEDGSSVVFNNSLSGEVTVTKKWFDKLGNPDTSEHSPLTLYIWQRKVGTTNWTSYTAIPSVVLSAENNWTQTVTGLLIEDADGNRYEYCIKEPDSYLATYAVAYNITSAQGNAQFFANDAGTITVDGATYKDPGFSLSVDSNGDYGAVEVTNTEVVTNTIPSTGGIGTSQFVAIGVLLMSIAFAGMMLFRKRKSF